MIELHMTEEAKNTLERPLTKRETDVVRLTADGLSVREIGIRLGVATRTVANHRVRIRRKTGIQSVALLARWAVRNGIVEP